VGIKTYIGFSQDAYDAECAALTGGTGIGFAEADDHGAGHIFMDAQAAIRRMASRESGPSQKYALQTRKHITVLQKTQPDIVTEIRQCPTHREIPRN